MNYLEKIEKDINYSKSSDIIGFIKSEILRCYPIVDNRMDILFSYPAPALDIVFNFGKTEKQHGVQIFLAPGNENIIHGSSSNSIIVDGLIAPDVINEIIAFLYKDHGAISNIYSHPKTIYLEFIVNMREDTMQGISCNCIKLELNFSFYQDYEMVQKFYLNAIVKRFYEVLKDTPSFIQEYRNFCYYNQNEIIKTSSKLDLINFLKTLKEEDLKKSLEKIEPELFYRLYNEYLENYCDFPRKLTQ